MGRRWLFDTESGQLIGPDRVATLTPKAASVLSVLCAYRGEVVPHETILAEVWGSVHVQRDIVREYIFDIRKAAGDSASTPDFIETVRKRGFRLIGDIEAKTARPFSQTRPVIAVLKPEVFSNNEKWAYLAESLAEDLTTDLARFPEISVLARHSAFGIDQSLGVAEAAKKLDAEYLIESSVSADAEITRVTFRLVHAKDEKIVWAERYDNLQSNLCSLSEDVAASVANALASWLGEVQRSERYRVQRKPFRNLNAYENYLQCCYHEHIFDEENTRLGLLHGKRAAEIDPYHARTWLLLSYLEERPAALFGANVDTAAERAGAALRRAFELDPRDPLILSEIAALNASEGNLKEAVSQFLLAADYGRNQADVCAILANYFVTVLGDFAEAANLLERAYQLNPFPPDWYKFPEIRLHFFGKNYSKASEIETGPESPLPIALFSALSTAMLDDNNKTQEVWIHFASRFPEFDFEGHRSHFPITAPKAVGMYSTAVARLRGH